MRRQSRSQLCLQRRITQQDQGLRSSPSCNNPIRHWWALGFALHVSFQPRFPLLHSLAERQLPACHFHQFSHQPLEITPSAEWHREETDWAVSLHSQGCRREDAAAQLKDHTDTPGEEGRDREGEKLAPLCVQDSSTATSCLEPWCRIANDHTGCSQQLFLIISIENSEIRHVLEFLGGGASCRLQQAQGGGWKQGGEGSHQQRSLVTQQQGPAACPVWSCSSWWPINSVFSLIVSASRQHKGSVLDFGMDRM